ncbi:MAG TPA: hypothetical protein VNH14_14515 [Gemmatimonadales bacterium]|nr:hypothetical protein [Gemmatimonadales bacterium]
MTDSLLTNAVRAALRYDGVGNLSVLREAAGFSGHGFAALRRGQRHISRSAARRLARVFATWARVCEMRADRITAALRNNPATVEENESKQPTTSAGED